MEIGKTRLPELQRKGVLTDALVQDLTAAGRKLKFPEVKVDWDQILDSYKDTNDLGRDQLKGLSEFTLTAQKARRELERELKGDEAPGRKDVNQLGRLDAYLKPALKVRDAYVEASARAALGAVAGASFGPLPALAAYLAWNPANEARTNILVDNLKELSAGTSSLISTGNSAVPVHQEKLWQAKLQLLDDATRMAEEGKPVEIDVQYFEMTSSSFMSRLAKAAKAGCPVRVNIDPSRPRQHDTADVGVDDGPRKLRALLQLASIPDADVAISIFPVVKELGTLTDLMHRKLLRVGDTVLLGGMNANEGSGENYDTGYLLQGPAAAQLIKGFQADIERSRGVDSVQVYGQKMIDTFEDGKIALSPHGLATTLDALAGPSPAGTRISSKPNLEELTQLCSNLGVKISNLVDMGDLDHALRYGATKPIELKPQGKKLLNQLIRKAFDVVESKENQQRLLQIELPSDKEVGNTTLALGDSSEEREALMLQAISSAEKFVYIPTFVLTKAIARALVARRDQLAEQGKELDVKVVIDAGIYGYGGTPNEEGYLALEDAGVPVRWSLLTRGAVDHDRKIHAKQILTDKMEMVGSNNLSNKAIRENWELSGLVMFDPASEESAQAQQDGMGRFERLWEHESISLDTIKAATAQDITRLGADESRKKAIRTFLGMIQNYEVQTGKLLEEKMGNPDIAQRAILLQASGMAFGYARMLACQEFMGDEAFNKALKELPMRQKLDDFAQGTLAA